MNILFIQHFFVGFIVSEILQLFNKYIYISPCHLVPSSQNRPLSTSMIAILHPALSLASIRYVPGLPGYNSK